MKCRKYRVKYNCVKFQCKSREKRYRTFSIYAVFSILPSSHGPLTQLLYKTTAQWAPVWASMHSTWRRLCWNKILLAFRVPQAPCLFLQQQTKTATPMEGVISNMFKMRGKFTCVEYPYRGLGTKRSILLGEVHSSAKRPIPLMQEGNRGRDLPLEESRGTDPWETNPQKAFLWWNFATSETSATKWDRWKRVPTDAVIACL